MLDPGSRPKLGLLFNSNVLTFSRENIILTELVLYKAGSLKNYEKVNWLVRGVGVDQVEIFMHQLAFYP